MISLGLVGQLYTEVSVTVDRRFLSQGVGISTALT